MALFKIFKGPEEGLQNVPKHEGYAYFTEDTGNFYIDISSDVPAASDGSTTAVSGIRVQVNAKSAKFLEDAEGNLLSVDDMFKQDMIIEARQGGTGVDNLIVNAVLIGNGTDPIKMIPVDNDAVLVGDAENGVRGVSGTGALYKLAENAPTFNTLPIEAGGTGGTTVEEARENLDVFSKEEIAEKITSTLAPNWYLPYAINTKGESSYTNSSTTIRSVCYDTYSILNCTATVTSDGLNLKSVYNSAPRILQQYFLTAVEKPYFSIFLLVKNNFTIGVSYVNSSSSSTSSTIRPSNTFQIATQTNKPTPANLGTIQWGITTMSPALMDGGQATDEIDITLKAVFIIAHDKILSSEEIAALKDILMTLNEETGEYTLHQFYNHDYEAARCSQYSLETGEWIGNQKSNKNYAINPNFANTVNRQSQTTYTANAMSIDKWSLLNSTDTSASLTVNSDSIRFQKLDTTYQPIFCQQNIKNAEKYSGATMTFSIMYKTPSENFVIVLQDTVYNIKAIPKSTTWNIVSITIPIKTKIDWYGVRCIAASVTANEYIDIKACKLEYGSVQTLGYKDGSTWVLNNDLPSYDESYSICQLYDLQTGNWIGFNNTSNPNILDNSVFMKGCLINQRGQTEYTTPGYTIDRWKSQNDRITVAIDDNEISTISFQSGSNRIWSQILEPDIVKFLNGKTLTLSVLADNIVNQVYVKVPGGTNDIPLVNGLLIKTFIYSPENVSNGSVYFWGNGGSFTPIAAKLELGTHQTLAHQDADGKWVLNEIPDPTLELLKCQRHRYVIGGNKNSYIGTAHCGSNGRIYFGLILPVPMRIAPTPSYIGNIRYVTAMPSGAVIARASTVANIVLTNEQSCISGYIEPTDSSIVIPGTVGWLDTNTANDYFIFDANQ